MEHPVLLLTRKKYSGESSVISIRLPKDMVSDIDELARYTGRSRNEVMQLKHPR